MMNIHQIGNLQSPPPKKKLCIFYTGSKHFSYSNNLAPKKVVAEIHKPLKFTSRVFLDSRVVSTTAF